MNHSIGLAQLKELKGFYWNEKNKAYATVQHYQKLLDLIEDSIQDIENP